MDFVKLKITKEYEGLTIKEVLKCFNIGKGKIEEIRVNQSFVLNEEKVSLETKVKSKDILKFFIKEKVDFVPYRVPLEVVYEDDYLLIVNKPSFMLIHPDDEYNDQTLVNVVSAYYYDHKIFRNVRYVHRIDYETSGIVVFAKDFLTAGMLNLMIEKHTLKRFYLALCMNRFSSKEGEINKPIGRDRHVQNKYRTGNSSNSKNALTYFQVEKEYKGYSLVKLNLETGRTHQIRVHMSSINHPLLGDSLYGGKKDLINRVSLHSYQVKFNHPVTKEYMDVVCPLPIDMENLLK